MISQSFVKIKVMELISENVTGQSCFGRNFVEYGSFIQWKCMKLTVISNINSSFGLVPFSFDFHGSLLLKIARCYSVLH